jgi:hypothetical protein
MLNISCNLLNTVHCRKSVLHPCSSRAHWELQLSSLYPASPKYETLYHKPGKRPKFKIHTVYSLYWMQIICCTTVRSKKSCSFPKAEEPQGNRLTLAKGMVLGPAEYQSGESGIAHNSKDHPLSCPPPLSPPTSHPPPSVGSPWPLSH